VDHFISKFLSFFFVGFGYLWRGSPLKGGFLLFLFFVFILRFVYWEGVIPDSMAQPSLFPWDVIFWGGFFLLFYFLSVRASLRMKPKIKREMGSLKGSF